jgi:alanine racemase
LITCLLTAGELCFLPLRCFFALTSTRRNGETFIEELYEKGVRGFVVNKLFDASAFPGANIYLLQIPSEHYRNFQLITVANLKYL